MVVPMLNNDTCVVYAGIYYTVEWYYDKGGYSEAFEYFLSVSDDQKRKFLLLVKKMADFGKIIDTRKFRYEGNNIFAFKPQPDRYLSFFVRGKRIVITNGFYKKSEKLPENEIQKATKYRIDYLNRNQEEK
ncbi:MAG: type II toxin-antitoxin system RelE/ParE family toxin [Fusobacteriaceae bacterium]|jgi:phage-related protein|nr:type II toxin-antitoxin system RelE/ParE family toxin [Fusobacteriaceae bacterium]